MAVIRLFAGFDPREEVGYHTFCSSVIHTTQRYVSIAPVSGSQNDGTNAFTYARFDVPRACEYKGWALFMDGSDMVVREDIGRLWDLRDPRYAVQLVKHDYKTKHPIKYVGTEMEALNGDYPRKNWSSVMLMNCEAPEWKGMQSGQPGAYYHRLQFIAPERVGELPLTWNWLVDEYGPADAAVLHWTCGIPAFDHYQRAPMADAWFKARAKTC